MKRLGLITIGMLVISLVFAASVNGCGEGGQYESVPARPPEPVPAPMAPREADVDITPEELATLPEERMIIRNGDISLVVEDVLEARDEIAQLAERLGGWVVNSNIYGDEETRGWISIRVPSNKFDQALSELRGLAVRVTSESTSTEDITEQYVDLQSRLRNAEATESQYLALLEQAIEVEDILAVYESLSRIRYEIEQIKGRMQYLERTSAMSLISINLEPAITIRPLVSPIWSARETLNTAVRGLTAFGQGLGTAFIWIGIFSPIWGTVLGITLWRRRKRKRAQS